jgi:hypothetical protein
VCHQLKLKPASNTTGLNQLHTAAKTSTWGGSVLRHDDGKYHMWASEITRHCGIHRWISNSVVVHAVAPGDSVSPPGANCAECQRRGALARPAPLTP